MALLFSVSSNSQKISNEILRKIEKMKKGDRRKALKQVGMAMVESVKSGYTKTKNPKGKKWPDLKYTVRPSVDGIARFWTRKGNNRFKVTNQSKPLFNTGLMVNSIGSTMIGGKEVIIGYKRRDRAEIARKHQFGEPGMYRYQMVVNGPIRKKKMTPQKRETIGFAWTYARSVTGKNDRDLILSIFRQFIKWD